MLRSCPAVVPPSRERFGPFNLAFNPPRISCALPVRESRTFVLMITSSTASAVLSVATGLIKLGQRLDQLLAEKTAVQAKLIQVMPAVYAGPSTLQKIAQLRAYLQGATT